MNRKARKLIIIVSIISMISLSGCEAIAKDKSNIDDTKISEDMKLSDITILGVEGSAIDQVILGYENINVYYDLQQDYQIVFMEELSQVLEETADALIPLEEEQDFEPMQEGDVPYPENLYYIKVIFKSPQTILFKEKKEEVAQECDGVLIDLTELRLYWSENDSIRGGVGFMETKEILKQWQSVQTYVKDTLEEFKETSE